MKKSTKCRMLKITITVRYVGAPLSSLNIVSYPSKTRRGAVNSKAISRTRRGKGVDLQLTTTRGSRSEAFERRDRERGAAVRRCGG